MHLLVPSCTRTSLSALLACLLCASVVLASAQTQPTPKPLSKDDVINLLKGDVPAKRVEALIREHGIDFQITPETESELRRAGANDRLLVTLRDLGPKPPTLIVTTKPGGAQVFVDDELIARTSAEGRLKISTLGAGRHKLRVSSDRYFDYEESIELADGKSSRFLQSWNQSPKLLLLRPLRTLLEQLQVLLPWRGTRWKFLVSYRKTFPFFLIGTTVRSRLDAADLCSAQENVPTCNSMFHNLWSSSGNVGEHVYPLRSQWGNKPWVVGFRQA